MWTIAKILYRQGLEPLLKILYLLILSHILIVNGGEMGVRWKLNKSLNVLRMYGSMFSFLLRKNIAKKSIPRGLSDFRH